MLDDRFTRFPRLREKALPPAGDDRRGTSYTGVHAQVESSEAVNRGVGQRGLHSQRSFMTEPFLSIVGGGLSPFAIAC